MTGARAFAAAAAGIEKMILLRWLVGQVCAEYGLTREELGQPLRTGAPLRARQIVAVLARAAGVRAQDISVFVNRDKPSIWNAVRKYQSGKLPAVDVTAARLAATLKRPQQRLEIAHAKPNTVDASRPDAAPVARGHARLLP